MRRMQVIVAILFLSCTTANYPEHTYGALLGIATIDSVVQPELEALTLYLTSSERPIRVEASLRPAVARAIALTTVDPDMTAEEALSELHVGLARFRRDFAMYVFELSGPRDQPIVVSSQTLSEYVTMRRQHCGEMPCPIPPCAKTCNSR